MCNVELFRYSSSNRSMKNYEKCDITVQRWFSRGKPTQNVFFSMYLEVGEAGSFSSNNLCKLGCGDLCQIYGIRNKDQVHVIPNHGFRGKEKCCKEYGLFNMYLLEFPKHPSTKIMMILIHNPVAHYKVLLVVRPSRNV